MNYTIENFKNAGLTVTVTDEHPASSYGVPVVLVDGNVLGDTETVEVPSHKDENGDSYGSHEATGYMLKLALSCSCSSNGDWDKANKIMNGAVDKKEENDFFAGLCN